MPDNSDANPTGHRERNGENQEFSHGHRANGKSYVRPRAATPPVDFWMVIDLLMQRWYWLVLGGCAVAALFLFLGQRLVQPKFTASAKLLRFETPGENDFFTTPLSGETFSGLLRSPELMEQIGLLAKPPVPPEKMLRMIKIEPDPDSDMISLALASRDPKEAVDLLNAYASNAVVYARAWYAQRAEVVASNYLRKELAQMDADIGVLHERFKGLYVPPELTNQLAYVGSVINALSTNLAAAPAYSISVARQREKLDASLAELNDLLLKYTELHPSVIAKREQIKSMESQISSALTNRALAAAAVSTPPSTATRAIDPSFNPEVDLVRTKLLSLEEGRVQLAGRQRQAELYAQNPPGVVRVFAPATMQSLESNHRRIKIGLVTIFGGLLGVASTLVLVLLVEFLDNRLKNPEDVKRVTKLPVLATLGDLDKMRSGDRSNWSFRAWTMLQGRLSPSANHGLVCGITSSAQGEGRSTWISLLAEAASLTGFRVLTIATKPTASTLALEQPREDSTEEKLSEEGVPMSISGQNTNALTTSVLTSPGQVTEQLTGPNSQPVVHIPLPGWVWNLERRKQWGEALSEWRQIDNLVILVELPPASVPEAVLLGSNLPNMLWLTDSGGSNAAETRTQLETLRNARCNLVGAVLNRTQKVSLRNRFPRWLGCVVLALALDVARGSAQEPISLAENDGQSSSTNGGGAFSISRPEQRAAWQKRLTLGAGDILTLGLFGQPDLTRTEVAIAPDGRVSYLEAQDVMANELTIDELRARLDEELGKYRRAPRTIITPVAFRSKRYYVLGAVSTKGVYTLDRPLTVLEAIARAHGVESGLVERNLIDLVDFQHSFLIRGKEKFPLHLDKLFQDADLSQNLPIEPGDYVYLASGDVKEVYVVGEVRLPGAVIYTPDLSVIGAITGRGGYTERAFKMRVLVIRGSLTHPQPIAVDTHAMLDGRARGFKLEPRDIVFVNSRPFIRVEELADLAATAFIQSIIASWVGKDVVKPFRE